MPDQETPRPATDGTARAAQPAGRGPAPAPPAPAGGRGTGAKPHSAPARDAQSKPAAEEWHPPGVVATSGAHTARSAPADPHAVSGKPRKPANGQAPKVAAPNVSAPNVPAPKAPAPKVPAAGVHTPSAPPLAPRPPVANGPAAPAQKPPGPPGPTPPGESTIAIAPADLIPPPVVGPAILRTIQKSADLAAGDDGAAVPTVPGYQIVGRLGEGGMGTVWRAVQIATRREVALKVMGAAALGSDRARRRFEREVELSARLDHPFVARVFDGGMTAGLCFYALELVEDAVPLDEFVAAHKLDHRRVLGLVRDVCRAVQHAHQLGIIHRDLKPGNILVTPDGRPKVLDFGLAKAVGGAGSVDTGEVRPDVTMAGEVAGTPTYMSPEQAGGHSDRIDIRSDVYTLGVILFRLLSGEFPHDPAGGYMDVIRRVSEDEPRRIKDVAPAAADRDLGAVLDKALEREPARRYGSAGELADDLDRYLAEEPIVARPPSLRYLVGKRVRRHKLPLAAAAVVAVAVAGTAVWSYVRVSVAKDRAEAAEADAVRQRDEATRLRAAADANAARATANADRANRNLATAAANAIEATRNLAYGQIATADALGNVNRWDRARQLYASAAAALAELKLDPLPVRLGRWDADRRAPPPLATLLVDAGAEEAVAFSRDGRLVSSGGSSRWLRVWELPNGRRVASVQAKTFVRVAAFANDASFVVSGGDEGIVRRDPLAAGGAAWERGGGTPLVVAVAVTPDDRHVLALTGDGKLTCRAAADGRDEWAVDGPRTTTGQIVCLPAASGNAAAGGNGSARAVVARVGGPAVAYDVATGAEAYRLPGGTDLTALCAVPGGKLLGGNRDGVYLWPANGTGGPPVTVYEVSDRRGPVVPGGLGVSPGGGTATVCGADFAVRLLDLGSRKVAAERGWVGGVRRAAVSPDGRTVVSGDNDGRAMVWGVEPGPELMPVYAHAGAVTGAAVSPDGRLLLSAGADRTLSLRDAATGGSIWAVGGRDVGPVAILPDNRSALVVEGPALAVWDLSTAKVGRTIGKTGEAKPLLAMSADGRHALTAGEKPPRLWDVAAGRDVTPAGGFAVAGSASASSDKRPPVVAAALSADGRWAVTGTKDEVVLWDTATAQPARRWEVEFRSTTAVAVTADGSRVAGGAFTGSVRVWDAATGRQVSAARGQFGSVRGLGFAPDGKWLLAGYASGMAVLYDPSSGGEMRQVEAHRGEATLTAASADGRRVATAGADGVVSVWNLAHPDETARLSAAVAAARDTLATAPDDGPALAVVAEWYAARGRCDWATDVGARARRHNANVSPLTMARCHWRLGHTDEAAAEFREALKRKEAPEPYLRLCLRGVGAGE
jgi:WD40 repeat protein